MEQAQKKYLLECMNKMYIIRAVVRALNFEHLMSVVKFQGINTLLVHTQYLQYCLGPVLDKIMTR